MPLPMVPLSNAIFYTTHTFDISRQIKDVQSTRAFFGDAAGGGIATEDPLWRGTRAVRSNTGPTSPPGASENKRRVLDGVEGEDEAEGEDGAEGVGFEVHKRNTRRRKRNAKKRNDRGPDLPPAIALSILQHTQKTQNDAFNVADFPHAASAFVGRSDRTDVSAFATRSHSTTSDSDLTVCLDDITVDESLSKLHPNCPAMVCNLITNHKYKYIVNDISVAQALADVHDLIYAVKVQQPKGDWAKIYGKAECAFEVLSEYYSLEPHRRGHYKICNRGITIGPGSSAPLLLGESESEAESEIHSAFIHEVEQYVRHFTVSARLWMPKLMEEYTDLQVELIAINSLLRATFPDSPFCAFTMNMGPHTVCIGHRDFWNLAYGTCPIGALGPFNHRIGGHIILHEPKVIFEFRRGDVMFIPSAAVTHENVPIAEDEKRYSLTMYTAGALFRHIWCGQQTVKKVQETDGDLYKRYVAEGPGRWEDGWKRYSTIDELITLTQA